MLEIYNNNMFAAMIWIVFSILINHVGCYITYTNSTNNLKELPDNIPVNVQHININYNEISYIDPELFSNFPSLVWLSAIGNDFQRIPDVGFLKPLLSVLFIGRNNFSEVTPDMFEGFESLDTLGLTYLNLIEFPDFGDICGVLEYLLIGHNKIVYINEENIAKLTNLRRLNIEDNRLETFPDFEYSLRSRLIWLKLDLNLITYMSPKHINGIQLINGTTVISLQENPWHCNCNMAYVKELAKANLIALTCAENHPSHESIVNLSYDQFLCPDLSQNAEVVFTKLDDHHYNYPSATSRKVVRSLEECATWCIAEKECYYFNIENTASTADGWLKCDLCGLYGEGIVDYETYGWSFYSIQW